MVAPQRPGYRSGYGLAIQSLLQVLSAEWDQISLLCFSPSKPKMDDDRGPTIRWVNPAPQSPLFRFIRSLGTNRPAVAWRAHSVINRVDAALRELEHRVGWDRVLLEDLGSALIWKALARPLEGTHVRLHNVMADAFLGLAREGPVWRRWAWTLEVAKIRRWEEALLRHFPSVSVLSNDDRDRVASLYGRTHLSVIPVSVELDRYSRVPVGSGSRVGYIGSADARKGHGLKAFIRRVWPRIIEKFPSAELVLAGRGTKELTEATEHVVGLGEVSDDVEVLSQCQVFVNPQLVGSGVKLKSLVALAAGRCLLSYPEDVRGLPGVAGRHYLVAATENEMVAQLRTLLGDPRRGVDVGASGRCLAADHFGAHKVREALPACLRRAGPMSDR